MNPRPKTARYAVRALACAAALTSLASIQAQAQALRYDVDYPSIDYANAPTDNPFTRLAAQIASGEVVLEYGERGYLDSMLEALNIDPGSQTLVYSKTSLQHDKITPQRPRAIYFNDDVYIAWLQNSDILELATMDPNIGVAFYLFHNRRNETRPLVRENGRCLNCHDTQGMMGGGVPLLMVRSLMVGPNGTSTPQAHARIVTDATPFEQRWGGWYVTGQHGDMPHRGNIILPDSREPADLDPLRLGNLDTLDGAGLFDTSPYLTDTSDVVALMVMEHQTTVQNAIIYLKFKTPFVLERLGMAEAMTAPTLDDMPPRAQSAMTRMLDDLVNRLLLADAITLDAPVQSTSGFDHWYQAQGPRDAQGRSLRDLDLQTRLLKHPLSPQIYSEAFDSLPAFALDYVYGRLLTVLRDGDGDYPNLSADDRAAILTILTETKPAFAQFAQSAGG